MSTRKAQRQAVVDKVKDALPTAIVVSDPDSQRLAKERPTGIVINVVRGRRDVTPSQEYGAVHQEASQEYLVLFLIPTKGANSAATEDTADDIFEALYAVLCPAAGWRPATDCDVMNLVEEDYYGSTAIGHVYVAVYSHGVLVS